MRTELVSTTTEERLTHRKASLDEFWALPESVLPTEYINGEIIMAPTPRVAHQAIVGNIYFILRSFVDERKAGRIYSSPLDVVLPTGDVVQPDLFFLTNEEAAIASQAKRVRGAPSFVVEVLSPGSVKHDAITKRNLYETNGVSEYWIVDPETRTISQLVLDAGHYALTEVDEAGVIRSRVLKGFEASVSQFFIL
ncbi:MAG TPA: Uma2 family endonuclease [Pyrinomonadaceae bacterium]|nr:Uma2 family endonuclease [Pyrinomonadaceae bacterium]